MLIDWYYHVWIIVIIFCVIVAAIKDKRIELIPFYYILAFSAFSGFFINRSIDPIVMVQYRNACLIGFAQGGFLLYFAKFPPSLFDKIMPHLFWLNLALTYMCYFLGLSWHGLGINLSLNGTLLALQLAFVLHRTKFIAPILTIIAVALTKSSMGILAIIVGMFFYYLLFENTKPRFRNLLIATPVMTIPIFLYFYGSSFFSLTGRQKIWALALEYMRQNESWIMGHGWGSWAYLGPKMQIDVGWIEYGLFIHLHSDILQLFFETGIIGISLFGLSFIVMALRFYRGQKLSELYFLIAFTVSCVGNFPLRLAPTMLMLGLIVWRARK